MPELEYWTTSTCGSCGQDGVNLTGARINGLDVGYHFVDHQPDPIVVRARQSGVRLPFFTDGHGFWPTSSAYLRDRKESQTEASETVTENDTVDDGLEVPKLDHEEED